MVSWASDGLIAGYDPITKKLKAGLYHFATPGSVDLGGVTRINYPMGAGLNTTTYPNRFQITAPFTFTSGDFTANPGKKLSAAAYVCKASEFDHIPTVSEIIALGDSKVSVYRATQYVTAPQTITFSIPGWTTGLEANVKYWVLVMPTALVNASSSWNLTNDRPMAGIVYNTFGRALSMWANRTPGKPIITSPPDGSIAQAGSVFTIKVNPTDPDEVSPEDATKFNDDVNGIQIQYAPVPTVDNPTPVWADLPYDTDVAGPYRYSAWYIRGSRDFNGLAGAPELEALVANLGCPVVAGAGDSISEYQTGKGALPTGEWQIRVRTFDYGHPYPNLGTSTTEPGPLGINPATTYILFPAKDTYPANNTSPWSDPVRISIPAQVPPPVPLSPKDETAVSGNTTVRLSWQYRNTHLPPRDQYLRDVQIRKVNDPEWSTVFTGASSDSFVDLPPSIVQTPVPDIELLADGDFEAGTTDGWIATDDASVANVNNALNAHSGSRYLAVTNAGPTAGTTVYRNFVPTADYQNFALDGWIWLPPSENTFVLVEGVWLDADDEYIMPDDNLNSPFFLFLESEPTDVSGWYHINDLPPFVEGLDDTTIKRPEGGVTLQLVVVTASNTLDFVTSGFRLDDLHFVGSGADLDSFEMAPTTHYEWRVRTTDTDAVESNYSTPARFWVVPAPDSGDLRPVPSDTTEGATLGCGTHRVEVYRRGGHVKVGEIGNMSHIDWGRVRDDISTAKIEVTGWDVDCGNLLSILQTWAYELVIFRDNGYSVDRVWEGPITLLTYEIDKVTIHAKDVMGYAYRRIIKQKMTDAGTGNGTTVVDRAKRVLQNVFAPDDPNVLAYLQVLAREDDAMQYRSTPAYSRTAFEEVDDMAANSGLDYTCVGRSILLWGTKHRIGTLPEFRDEDLGASPIVSEYGMSMANRYVVSDGNGIWGEATRLDDDGNDETYGLVEMLSSTWASDSESETGTYTQAGLQTMIESFESFAERSISDRYPAPVVVRVPDNTTLNPGAVVSIQHLVPGVVIPLRTTGTLRELVASQKLDSVNVVEEGGKETVSITLSPFSRDDAGGGDTEVSE